MWYNIYHVFGSGLGAGDEHMEIPVPESSQFRNQVTSGSAATQVL